MGSSGTGSMVTLFCSAVVTRTLPPGFNPIFSRISAGMTTCPLAEVFTIGIFVHLIHHWLNVSYECITLQTEGVKGDRQGRRG